MKFALVDEIKSEPSPGLKGKCASCGANVTSKCGSIKIWHWSHSNRRHCDPWWENEGPWHRAWKENFPRASQEVLMIDELSGEKHIADLKTDNGIVIELQNSNIDIEEIRSREIFYENMVWIVNAEKFTQNLILGQPIPSPESEIFQDFRFHNRTFYGHFDIEGSIWHLASENEPDARMVLAHGASDQPSIVQEIRRAYKGDHLGHWKNPRKGWLLASKQIYLDIGEDYLYQFLLDHPMAPKKYVFKIISKSVLINLLMSKIPQKSIPER